MPWGWLFGNGSFTLNVMQPPRATKRLEWISLVYLLFFVLTVLSPSIYRRDYFGISQTTLEEITIFLFGLAGLLTFTFYERFVERRARERERVQLDYDRAKKELMESYAYIGSINRKIELLKNMAKDASTAVQGKQLPKELFHALAANACAAAGAQCALLRFVELEPLRTEREFSHEQEGKFAFRIANRDLKHVHEQGLSHALLESEDHKKIAIIPSDQARGPYKAYLLLHVAKGVPDDFDVSLLKIFVNQAEALYHNFTSKDEVVLKKES